jgi:nitroreductase
MALPPTLRRVLIRSRELARIAREHLIDGVRHARWSAPTEGSFSSRIRGKHLETQLTKDYHRVEKGLALAEPKRPFGAELLARMDTGIPGAPVGPFSNYAVTARQALREWNQNHTIDDAIAEPRKSVLWGPSEQPTLDRLFESRRSVRHFAPEPVDESLLHHAIDLAANAPSVCNRQATRVHHISDPELAQRVLALQNGNRGFGHVPTVLIVTTDLRLFAGASERNQRWIDGGLFAMTLVWALHAQGLATCMLNWSMNNSSTDRLRAVAGLEPWEDVITYIAVGNYPNEYRVARSPRRSRDEILISHTGTAG